VERGHPILVGRAKPDVDALVQEGLLVECADRLACTDRGFLLLDGILERLTGATGNLARDLAIGGSWPGKQGSDSFDNVLGRR
jgi:hypothetical protein